MTKPLFLCFFSSSHRIKHPNIVSLEDIFESKSHLYLIMQLWVFTHVWDFVFVCRTPACAIFYLFFLSHHTPEARSVTRSGKLYEGYRWAAVGRMPSYQQPVGIPPTSAAKMSVRYNRKDRSVSEALLTVRRLIESNIYLFITAEQKKRTAADEEEDVYFLKKILIYSLD